MTIRIALVIPTMDRGGAEKQLCLLAENLPQDEFDVHVFLLTRDGPRSERLRKVGIDITVIGKRFKLDPTALFRLRAALKSFRPDLVHTWIFAANAFGRLAASMAGVPAIIASERCVDPWKGGLHFAIDRWLAKKSMAITTNSVGVRDFYAQHGIDPQLFEIIPNGIELYRAPVVDRDEVRERLQVDPGRKLILAVGRLWPQKRYRDLIWAAELLASLRQDTSLVIVGDGPQKAELLRFRDSVTCPQHVRFVGSRSDVADLLTASDLFWIGSEYEGQSNAVIEAMQAGVPIIGSDIPGNRDLIVPNVTGRLVDLGDRAGFARETHDLLENPEVAKGYGVASRQRIEDQFSVQAMVDRHVDLYRRLAKEHVVWDGNLPVLPASGDKQFGS